MKVVQTPLPVEQYYPQPQKKQQIVLHHTVSNPLSAQGDVDYWMSDTPRIATAYIIAYDGTINRCFPSSNWAHHLGVRVAEIKAMGFKDFMTRNEVLNRNSIGIELDSWGGLTKTTKGFVNAYGKLINPTLEVIEYNWRGYKYYQKYSDAQIQALKELLTELMKRYSIPSYGIKNGDFNQLPDAIGGKPGIYSHSSYRRDKSDLYPDERIIKMLNSL